MRQLTVNEKNIVSLLTLTLFAFFALDLVIDPAIKSRGLDTRIQVSLHKLEKYRALVRKKALYRSVTSAAAGSANEALAGLEKMARETGIRIIEIRPESGQGGNELSVSLATEASEENFMRFLYELERSNLMARRVQLSAKPGSDDLEGSFSLATAGY
jgi:hypothetical protein